MKLLAKFLKSYRYIGILCRVHDRTLIRLVHAAIHLIASNTKAEIVWNSRARHEALKINVKLYVPNLNS